MKNHLALLAGRIFRQESYLISIPLILSSLGVSLVFSSYCIFSGLHEDFFKRISTDYPHILVEPESSYTLNRNTLLKLEKERTWAGFSRSLVSQGIVKSDSFAVGSLILGEPDFHDDCICSIDKKIPCLRSGQWLQDRLALEPKIPATLIIADGSHHDFCISPNPSSDSLMTRYRVNIPLETAQDLIYEEPVINRVELHLTKPFSALDIAKELKLKYPELLFIPWQETFKDTLQLFQAEKHLHIGAFIFILTFIALSIHFCFTMLFLKKKQTFCSLMVLGIGANRFKNLLSFICHSIFIISAAGGILLSILVDKALKLYPVPLPESLFWSKTIPFHWDWYALSLSIILLYITTRAAFHNAAKKLSPENWNQMNF
jgi:ABC-type lipoprotein release transport system permease subunit